MNYDEINKVYQHMKAVVYPNVQTLWKNVSTEEVIIDRYLSVIDDARLYKMLAIPYLFRTEDFLKRYKERCIIFYNTPDPIDGLMLMIHQITPTLHIHSRLFCRVESCNGDVFDYTASLVFHKDSKEAVQFINDNQDLARQGNTEERSNAGFKSV